MQKEHQRKHHRNCPEIWNKGECTCVKEKEECKKCGGIPFKGFHDEYVCDCSCHQIPKEEPCKVCGNKYNHHTPVPEELEEWTSKFDKEFRTNTGRKWMLTKEESEEIKSFIHQLLKAEKEEIQQDLKSVIGFLKGTTERQKIVNYIKEYLVS